MDMFRYLQIKFRELLFFYERRDNSCMGSLHLISSKDYINAEKEVFLAFRSIFEQFICRNWVGIKDISDKFDAFLDTFKRYYL